MVHKDHVGLIAKGIPSTGGLWADLGSGTGAFTLALRDIAGPRVKIYSVDKDPESLSLQKKSMEEQFPGTDITYISADFTKPLSIPPLDGIIMANSLHFVEHKVPVLRSLRNMLKPNGSLIIVEYNTDDGNMWVPYPFSFPSFQKEAQKAGYEEAKLLATVPSGFLKEIYSAVTS